MNSRQYAFPITVLSLLWVSVLAPTNAFAVCQGVSGQWSDNYGYNWNLTQTGTSISGTVSLDCGAGWTVSGSINTGGSFQITASGGGCPAYTFTYSGSLSGTACDSGSGTWQNDLGDNGYWNWSKDCDKPDTETTSTSSLGWYNYNTEYVWLATLQSYSGLVFGGRTVDESDGGGGTDSCWFSGSSIDPQTTVSPSSGTVAWNQTYMDTVGWIDGAVTYYRTNAPSLPCGFTKSQVMAVACSSTTSLTYKTNALSGTIYTTNVQSCRDGNCQTTTWP